MAAPRDPVPKKVEDRLVTLGSVLVREEDVMDRAFALGVGTRELFDTIRDPTKTTELYTSLGSTNIKVSAWKPLSKLVLLPLTAMPLNGDKDEHVKLGQKPFTVFQRLVQRYRADSSGVPYLVSSVEYLCLYDADEPVPRLFVLFRISQTPTQQFGDIMQLHEYITFYRRGRTVLDGDDEALRDRLRRVDAASSRRTMVNYRPSIEYAGSKPVLHHLIRRIAIPSMRKAFSDWVAALGPLAARFADELLARAKAMRATERAEAEARQARLDQEFGGMQAEGEESGEDVEEGRAPSPAGGSAGSGGSPRRGGEAGKALARSRSDSGASADGASGRRRRRASSASAASAGGGAESAEEGTTAAAREREGVKKLLLGSLSSAKRTATRLKQKSRDQAKSGQDVRRLEARTEAMRRKREQETRRLRRLVHAHVNGEAVTMQSTGSAGAGGAGGRDGAGVGGGDAAPEEDPAARARRLREEAKRAAMEVMAEAERETDFGFLDRYSLAGDPEAPAGAGLMLAGAGEEDLTGRFWAQTFTRDCSIWPGDMEGDDPGPAVDLFAMAFGAGGGAAPWAAGQDDDADGAATADNLDAVAPMSLAVAPGRDGPTPAGPADTKGRAETRASTVGAPSSGRAAAAAAMPAVPSGDQGPWLDPLDAAAEERKRQAAMQDPAERQAHLLRLLVGDGAARAIGEQPGADVLPPRRAASPESASPKPAEAHPAWGFGESKEDDAKPAAGAAPPALAAPPSRGAVLMTVAGVDATPASLADLLGAAPAPESTRSERPSPSPAGSEGYESDGPDDFRPINGSVGGLSIPRKPKLDPVPPLDDTAAQFRGGRAECTPADMPCSVM